MTNVNPPAASAPLHSNAGKALAAETTTFTAGQGIVLQNNGDTAVHVNGTTAGTGVVLGLLPANNLNITIALGNNLFGPFDPAVFGSVVTITTATAAGSVALYHMPPRVANGLHNPFSGAANPNAPDA